MIEQAYILADADYYEPLEAVAERGREFRPAKVPDGWQCTEWELWRGWRREGLPAPEEGWKVHVSARAQRFGPVLDVFAEECFARGIPFKHVAASRFLMLLQHKHASRTQSGKLLVAYPADEEAAAALMAALSGRLAEEEGQYILTDRRYAGSTVVHYRYGSFVPRARLLPDGTRQPLVRDGRGRLVPDRREPRFRLPEGITDPFAAEPEQPARRASAGFQGFTFERAIRHSNGGGTYVGRQAATGRKVFIKEAREHAGLAWDGSTAVERTRREWRTLQALHAALPGICPEPVAYFREWEHEFLVTEFVEGTTLSSWVVARSPLPPKDDAPPDFGPYLADCEAVAAALEEQTRLLHDAGYVFGDLSPGNVLVDSAGRPRLVDFEAARGLGEPAAGVATEGYAPPAHLVREDPAVSDDYGLSGLVRLMLGPTFDAASRDPHSLAHLRAELEEYTPVPPRLWERAVRYHPATGPAPLPGPDEVAADPLRHVRDLRDKVAGALTAMADPENPHRMFPTVPAGYASNTLGVAYGSAGVLHALRQCGIAPPDGAVERLRRDATGGAAALPPGLHTGLAGLAWVLAEYGYLDEARDLLGTATGHPLLRESAALAHGAAGVALTHLSLFGRTGDDRHVEAAQRLLEPLPADDGLLPLLGADDPSGWLHGRCGIAWALLPLGLITGAEPLLDRGVRLLHHELDRATHPDTSALHFPVSAADRRSVPYLYTGTAGMLRTVARYNRVRRDERLHAAESRLLPRLRTTYTVMPGLYQGLAGLGFALAEHAALHGEPPTAALRTARALYKYAVPGPAGVRFLGEGTTRLSADLWSGGAGVLLFLDEVLRPRRDRLFSLDTLTDREESHD